MNETRADGKLEAIWVKRFKRGPMDEQPSVQVHAGRGIDGNANQGGKRQVTIVSREAWETISRDLGASVDPRSRRANFLVSGIDLRDSRGRLLRVGDVRLRIHGETRPCERMDEAHGGLREALGSEWRGGAFGEVLDDGTISVGDVVTWLAD
jgi:MOSC domain-containing protein YiiM